MSPLVPHPRSDTHQFSRYFSTLCFLCVWFPCDSVSIHMGAGDDSLSWLGLGPLLHLGLTFVACVVIGLAGGYWLDRALGTSPWLLLAGLGIGIAAAFVTLFRAVKAADRSEGADGH